MDIHKNRIILTIGRQFGSGGREIGKKLAKAFGIGYYDSELITVAAQESGLCKEVFEKADERAANSLSYARSRLVIHTWGHTCLIMISCPMMNFSESKAMPFAIWQRKRLA